MAEFLIKAVSATHVDPVKDQRGCYKRGDIVDVRPDGFEWGKEEGPPRFYVIKIPGLKVEDAKKYKVPEFDVVADPYLNKVFTRRLYKVLVDDHAGMKSDLESKGSVSLPWNMVKDYVFNKAIGKVEGSVKEK